jgi:cytochrome P450
MMAGSPWKKFNQWAKEYGPVFTFQLFGSNAFVVSDPDILKVILQTKITIFQKDLEWVYKPFLVILGNGLVTAHGESWRRQRTLLSQALRIEILEFIPSMALRAVHRLSLKLDKICVGGAQIEMAEEFRHLTLQVIAEAILSLSADESDSTFAHMYLPIVEEGNLRTWHPERMFLPLPSYFKHNADVRRLNDYVTSLISQRWEAKKQERVGSTPTRLQQDILDKVLDAIPESEWGPSTISQVRDEVKTFILAGHETSASMLTWTLYELACNPLILEKLRAAAVTAFGSYNGGSIRSITSLPRHTELSTKLEYADCCLRESLRKYSVVPTVVRVASQDVEIQGHVIPQGTSVMINIMAAHHNERYWPNPDTYDPDRFSKGEGSLQPYTFLPFVDGPRNCLGQFLSLLETKIVLSLLVHHYDFELVNREEAAQTHPYMVPIIPKHGHFMKVSRR